MRLRLGPLPTARFSPSSPPSPQSSTIMPPRRSAPVADSKKWYWGACAAAAVVVLFLFFGPNFGTADVSGSLSTTSSLRYSTEKSLRVATWNIAAINNNPFEYWITHKDKAYNKLMADVQAFIDTPGNNDVPVKDVFTENMFAELKTRLIAGGTSKDFADKVEKRWNSDFKSRKIVSGFLKDPVIGSKRLASMPDRVTNTIGLASGDMAYRPTVINCYKGHLGSIVSWWEQWKEFMFETKYTFKTGEEPKTVSSILVKIKKSKYPAITTEEETISIPLQTLAAAIFDAVLVHMMNIVGGDTWQGLRTEMCNALNLKKMDRTQEILESAYTDADVILLQEVSQNFIKDARTSVLNDRYYVLAPEKLNRRDQNSIVMLRKALFDITDLEDATKKVYGRFDKTVPVAEGDVYAFFITDAENRKYFFASFHGDTNGLATIPVLQAVYDVWKEATKGGKQVRFIFGLDANTYEHAVKGKTQDVMEFAAFFHSLGMNSCWGRPINPANHTTYNARTYLQTQLNKASSKSDILKKGDVNPKDFILFFDDTFKSTGTTKDNTGKHKFIENMVFPTLSFPSDHGILSSTLTLIK